MSVAIVCMKRMMYSPETEKHKKHVSDVQIRKFTMLRQTKSLGFVAFPNLYHANVDQFASFRGSRCNNR